MSQVHIKRYALVVAGGTGTRMGAGIPKQMMPLDGRALLAHTLDKFLAYDPDIEVMTVLHASLADNWPAFLDWHFAADQSPRLHVCLGGESRTESVRNGLQALHKRFEDAPGTHALVAIHDAVRPFIDERLLNAGFALAEEKGNAVASVPVKSSVRMLSEDGSRAVDRSQFYHVQTPQIFDLDAIREIYEQADESVKYTDDASLAEAHGLKIQLFLGSYENIKITTPEDMHVAEHILNSQKDSGESSAS